MHKVFQSSTLRMIIPVLRDMILPVLIILVSQVFSKIDVLNFNIDLLSFFVRNQLPSSQEKNSY